MSGKNNLSTEMVRLTLATYFKNHSWCKALRMTVKQPGSLKLKLQSTPLHISGANNGCVLTLTQSFTKLTYNVIVYMYRKETCGYFKGGGSINCLFMVQLPQYSFPITSVPVCMI